MDHAYTCVVHTSLHSRLKVVGQFRFEARLKHGFRRVTAGFKKGFGLKLGFTEEVKERVTY